MISSPNCPQSSPGTRSGSSMLLGENFQITRGVQFALTLAEEEAIFSTPIRMMSHSLVIFWAIGTKVQKNSIVTIEKMKVELAESASSLRLCLD